MQKAGGISFKGNRIFSSIVRFILFSPFPVLHSLLIMTDRSVDVKGAAIICNSFVTPSCHVEAESVDGSFSDGG
jgi:hypothetical protein